MHEECQGDGLRCHLGIIWDIEDGNEILLSVLNHLNLPGAARLASSCKRFRDIHSAWFPWRAVEAPRVGEGVAPGKLKDMYLIESRRVLVRRDLKIAERSNFDHSDFFSIDTEWARDVAAKLLASGRLLRKLGQYRAAEEVLLSSVFGSRDDLPPENPVTTVDGDVVDPGLLEGALCKALAYMDQTGARDDTPQEVIRALRLLASELALVSQEMRLSFHYFNMMRPWASRAMHYAERAVKLCRREGVATFDMQTLCLVNRCWLSLSVVGERTWSTQLTFNDGLGPLMSAARSQAEILAMSLRADDVAMGHVEQLIGTSFYCEAAYLLGGPHAVACYNQANDLFERAIAIFERKCGADSLEYATCAVELGICWGNRRRTVDLRPRARLTAAKWYHAGYQIRRRILGEQHPLTVRAMAGYLAHSAPEAAAGLA